ncbi:hypothetical protein HAP98_08095 [Acidithiobacillus caldus]|uniref:Uncharacterized protein n=1 Tax=Acidithiobacillus caldus TaxID=33059 RepID=Q840R7_9PROT|nr:hypothetical protein [Acidithiobacillus caldus]AAP04743.1 mobilization protein of unknown function [Acidithiobacillus caldus]MBU2780245.1 hypothetical protein [Acidithiobacillus caldus]
MSDLKKAIGLITGREPTPEDINRVSAIAHALDIPQNDAMFPILVTLDAYYGTFSKLPKAMENTANKIASNAEEAAKGRISAASSELLSKAGQQLVDAFRSDLGKTLWSRSVWAGLVLVVVGIGSYAAGEVDIWWHSKEVRQVEQKLQRLKAEEAAIQTRIGGIVQECPAFDGIQSGPCVPIDVAANVANNFGYEKHDGKTVYYGRLDIGAIEQAETKQHQ